MNIVEFLEARIAEDEAVAAPEIDSDHAYYSTPGPYRDDWGLWTYNVLPALVLAECAAKRALMDDLFSYEAEIDYERGCNHTARQIRAGECDGIKPEEINGVQILAAVYDQHPDYDQAWRVT